MSLVLKVLFEVITYINQSGHTRSARNFVVTEKKIMQMTNLPIELNKVFKFFLKRGGKIFATVTGNKFFQYRIRITVYVVRTHFRDKLHADVEKLRTLLKPTAT